MGTLGLLLVFRACSLSIRDHDSVWVKQMKMKAMCLPDTTENKDDQIYGYIIDDSTR